MILLTIGSAGLVFAEPAKEGPLLIQFGQVTPDTRLLRKHAAYWEQYLPFDGLVIELNAEKYAGRYGNLGSGMVGDGDLSISWHIFSPIRFDPADYEHAIEDLKAAKFRKFKHNFLLVCVTAGGTYDHKNMKNGDKWQYFAFDWFDDETWQTVLHNVKVIARIAKEGGCKGLFLDLEQYGSYYWWFSKLREGYPDRPQDWDSYETIIRQRAQDFMQAINSVFPGCEIMTCFGSSYVYRGQTDAEKREKPHDRHFSYESYGMVAPFMDGLLLGADKDSTIHDGYEMSYYYKSIKSYGRAKEIVKYLCKAYSKVPELYSENIKLAFGIFPTASNSFDPHDFSKGDFTPDEFAHAVRTAMNLTDKYVWIWNEAATYWIKGGPEGKPLLGDHPHELGKKPTVDNMMSKKYYGIPMEFIEAMAKGKAQALEDVKLLLPGQ